MKTRYRIRNWNDYNKSLIQRGSITVWLSEDAIRKWTVPKECGKRGRPKIYSDDAILTMLVIRSVFHLPLRALQGFLTSLFLFLSMDLLTPSYTQICRRSKSLGQKLKKLSRRNIKDVVIDSTGLKVYGEGEWKVRQHGTQKRRTWRKLHLAVCPDTNEIIFEVLTENKIADRNAVLRGNKSPSMKVRDMHLLEISGLGGDDDARRLWKKLKGYHRRSLAETAMFRFKKLFGNGLKSRTLETQRAESWAKCKALNIMTSLGMPESELIAA